MMYAHDPMLAEIRQIRKALWDESGHDLHTMIRLIKQEAREFMTQYGRQCQERNTPVKAHRNDQERKKQQE